MHIAIKKRSFSGIQLILKLKEKDSIKYLALLSALEEFNDGVCEYKIQQKYVIK